MALRKVEWQVKVLIKNLAIFFLFPRQGVSAQKQKEQRQKQVGAEKLVTTQIWRLKNLMSLPI
jgi:hypothetical protein